MAEKRTEGGIQFGNWKLIPMDANNWELAHYQTIRSGDNAGASKWKRLGKYYQYNTITSALRYAVDYEIKARHRETVATFRDYMREYEETTERLVGEIMDAARRLRGAE